MLTMILSSCAKEVPQASVDTTTQNTEQNDPVKEPTHLRVLLTSDIHCTFVNKWYGLSNEERMQHWVDSVLAEHEKDPFDLIIFPGDLSLDFWDGNGTYEKYKKSTTQQFIQTYVSKLPADIPKLYIPGNHEAFTNEKWKEITGFDRQFSYLLDNNLFICLDTFGPGNQTQYTPVDVNFVKSEMEKYPDAHVYLVAHAFYENKESEEFKKLLKDNRIVGLFQGHTHISDLIVLSDKCANKILAQSGHFSFSEARDALQDFWGFRDIVITDEYAISSYYQVKSYADARKCEQFIDIPAQVDNIQKYFFR